MTHSKGSAILTTWGIVAAVVAVTAFGWERTVSAQDSEGIQGDADRGKTLFTDYTCFGCHGYTGETGLGPRLNPPRFNQERFIAYLRNPPNPRRMPPYQQAEASDQRLADIYAFLQSLESGSPAAENIPLLNAILQENSR